MGNRTCDNIKVNCTILIFVHGKFATIHHRLVALLAWLFDLTYVFINAHTYMKAMWPTVGFQFVQLPHQRVVHAVNVYLYLCIP